MNKFLIILAGGFNFHIFSRKVKFRILVSVSKKIWSGDKNI